MANVLPYLSGHFFYNIWAAPCQDNQSIIRPDRVTPFGGARNYVDIHFESYVLPTKHDRYHAYTCGQVNENVFNLPMFQWHDRSTWVNMANYCKESKVTFQFYTKKGIIIPLSLVYMTLTLAKNVVFVIRENPLLDWDMNEEDVTFRTYRNVSLTVPEARAETVDIIYREVKGQKERNELLTFYKRYQNATGHIKTFVNGYLVNNPISHPILLNDTVEIIYDSSIYRMIELQVPTTPTFNSKLDGIRKYLFTHDKSYKQNLFEYFDDCDFYLMGSPKKTPLIAQGVMLHRNDETNIRQVTNCDFAISTNLVKTMIQTHLEFLNEQVSTITFRVFYRRQARTIKTPYIAPRLHELNKLPYRNRIAAMIGARSNIVEWKAENLENSVFARTISLSKPICDLETIQDVYGYNGAVYYTAKSVHRKADAKADGLGGFNIAVPYVYRKMCTVYEYDANGKLLQWTQRAGVNQYKIVNRNTAYVEFIAGYGSSQPLHFYGDANNEYKMRLTDSELRVYSCLSDYADYAPENVTSWTDVTDKVRLTQVLDETSGFTTVSIQKLPRSSQHPTPMEVVDRKFAVRNDWDFLSRDIEVAIADGNLKFNLMQKFYDASTAKLKETAVKLPYGYLDIFLNGSALIEGIDYFVNFPEVYIVNKSALNHRLTRQKITYRMYGFPDTETVEVPDGNITATVTRFTGKLNAGRQVGYISHKMLSRNGVWEILEDKNLLVKAGNGVVAREDLGFSELNTLTTKRADVLEGKPYEIIEIMPARRDAWLKDTVAFRNEALDMDKRVANYMSQFFSDRKIDTPSPIQGVYYIFSPMLSRIVSDMAKRQLRFPNLTGRYLDSEVIAFVDANYGHLVKFDPYFRQDLISFDHVIIHPTEKETITTIDYHYMRLLTRIVTIYYRDEVEIEHFVRIGDQ